MTRDELSRNLDTRGVPKDAYCLSGGLPNEAFTMDRSGDKWFVYYSERGSRTGLREFDNEHDACDYFFRIVTGPELAE